jgi:hypothetical protein
MFRNFANKLYGASSTSTHDAANANARSAPSASAPRPSTDDADARPPTTFADRWMMSWTDEDVTFLGEDPYGDCAGNIFAQAAVESQRRGRASEDGARDEPRSSVDGGARRASEDVARSRVSAEEKTRAFFRIGPT